MVIILLSFRKGIFAEKMSTCLISKFQQFNKFNNAKMWSNNNSILDKETIVSP